VSIDELARRVDVLAERLRRYQDVFRRNEAAVRTSLVEPFLRIWGWDTEDPAQVMPEFSTQSGRPDYALLGPDGRPIAFVGVKTLGKPEDLTQYISYCVSEGVGYFIATDGKTWEVYNTLEPKPLREKLVARWDILEDPPVEVLRKSFVIARGVRERLGASEPIGPGEDRKPPPPRLTLAKIKSAKVRPPFIIIFPDQQRYSIQTWKELLTSVVEWLVKTGRLTEKHLPLKTPRSTKRYIVNTSPKHPTGTDFREPKSVLGVYVETAIDIKRMTYYLLREFGVDPNGVVVETGS
jgi:hypothetical protein